jgi:hypothetical protein
MAMELGFYILLSVRTPAGFDSYGQYFLGNDRNFADLLFDSFKGREPLGSDLLHIDLMETTDEIPVKIKSISCTLEELTCNIKLIVRGIFRQKNLTEFNGYGQATME